jgi:hypothetical protein
MARLGDIVSFYSRIGLEKQSIGATSMPEKMTPTVQQPVTESQERPGKDSVQIRFDGKSHPIDYLFTGAAIVAALVLNVSLGE